MALRSAVLPVVLMAIAFVREPSGTFRAVLQQPTVPEQNHPTPWLAFAPRVPSLVSRTIHTFSTANINGHIVLQMTTKRVPPVVVVSGVREDDLLVGALLGAVVWRRPQPPVRLVWLAAVVLAARCGFEAVIALTTWRRRSSWGW